LAQAALNKLRADKDKEADGLKAIIAEFEKKAKAMQVGCCIGIRWKGMCDGVDAVIIP
jgi:hypothetical protein